MMVSVSRCSSPVLPASLPLPIILDSCMSMPGWPCWSAYPDARLLAPSFESLSPAHSSSLPLTAVLDSSMSMPDCSCCSVWTDARLLAPFSESPSPAHSSSPPLATVLVTCIPAPDPFSVLVLTCHTSSPPQYSLPFAIAYHPAFHRILAHS